MDKDIKIQPSFLGSFPHITLPKIPIPKDHRFADTFYERLRQHIQETERELKNGEQLAVYYYGQGTSPVRVIDIGYHNPNLIILYGLDPQVNQCSILVHMEAVQLILKIEKVQKKSEARKMGFIVDSSNAT